MEGKITAVSGYVAAEIWAQTRMAPDCGGDAISAAARGGAIEHELRKQLLHWLGKRADDKRHALRRAGKTQHALVGFFQPIYHGRFARPHQRRYRVAAALPAFGRGGPGEGKHYLRRHFGDLVVHELEADAV